MALEITFSILEDHSLIAIQVLSRIREEFGIDLPLITIFSNPSVEQLGALEALDVLERPATSDRVADLLQRIDRMTDKQAKDILNQRVQPADDVDSQFDE